MEARGLKSLIESLAPYPPTPRRRPLRFRCLVRAVGRWMCLGYTRWYTSAPAPSTGCRARRPQCFDKLRLRSQKASSLAVVVARALRAIAGSRVRKLMRRGRSNLLLIANALGACIATSARARDRVHVQQIRFFCCFPSNVCGIFQKYFSEFFVVVFETFFLL